MLLINFYEYPFQGGSHNWQVPMPISVPLCWCPKSTYQPLLTIWSPIRRASQGTLGPAVPMRTVPLLTCTPWLGSPKFAFLHYTMVPTFLPTKSWKVYGPKTMWRVELFPCHPNSHSPSGNRFHSLVAVIWWVWNLWDWHHFSVIPHVGFVHVLFTP